MKKLIIAAAALMVSLAASYGQGTFAFNNRALPDVNAQVVLSTDATGSSLAGDAYSWQLVGGATGSALSAAQPLATGIFRTGAAAGYIDAGTGAAIAVPGVADGAKADVWMNIYQGANASGSILSTFGPYTVQLSLPPATPNFLPMGTSPLTVQSIPEPTTLALGLIGLSSLLFIRRRS